MSFQTPGSVISAATVVLRYLMSFFPLTLFANYYKLIRKVFHYRQNEGLILTNLRVEDDHLLEPQRRKAVEEDECGEKFRSLQNVIFLSFLIHLELLNF